MPINDYDKDGCFGRDAFAQQVAQQAVHADADAQRHRGQLIDGPANRGKSWVLCKIRDELQADDRAIPLLLHIDNIKFNDLLAVAAELWVALYPKVPGLFRPQSINITDAQTEQSNKLYAFFLASKYNIANIIAEALKALELANPTIYLVLLIDGLDEFERADLELLEYQFVAPLFQSECVRIVATRRSEVVTHAWRSFLLRQQTHTQMLEPLQRIAAEQQLNYLAAKQPSPPTHLHFGLFKFYSGQNPGANKQLFANLAKQQGLAIADVKAVFQQLSRSPRHTSLLNDTDFDWLIRVVRRYPDIAKIGASRHEFNAILGDALPISDHTRNAWLGRLQARGIIVVELNGACRVHEEFALLCLEP